MPRFLTIAVVGALCGAAAVALRYALTPLAGDVAPYAFVFAAVTIAAIAAGWESGLVALAVGQYLSFTLVVAPGGHAAPSYEQPFAFLIVATVAQLLVLLVIGLYQREVDRGAAQGEERLRLLDDALREIDHRTRNNYQTVLAMIDLQARRAEDPKVSEALAQVGDRIQAIANASRQLAVRSGDLDAVRLDDHLRELVGQIERGLSREGIAVECKVEEVTATADTATSISIIVNELVTNAIKHAFNGEASGHVWVKGRSGKEFELIVADDGRGIQASQRNGHVGLGSRLVDSFAHQLGARHEVVSTSQGTEHRLTIPRLS